MRGVLVGVGPVQVTVAPLAGGLGWQSARAALQAAKAAPAVTVKRSRPHARIDDEEGGDALAGPRRGRAALNP